MTLLVLLATLLYTVWLMGVTAVATVWWIDTTPRHQPPELDDETRKILDDWSDE